jgi:predicted kinase
LRRDRIRLVIITGLPGSGKSVLACFLARRYGALLLSKDLIKEPLLDVLGAGDAAHSKQLSDASFAALFAVARQALSAELAIILEGNFRPGEHEEPLRAMAAAPVQILCRVDEPTRLARLARRRQDSTRHAGHGDGDPGVAAQRTGDAFLELPGKRLTFDGGESAAGRELEAIDRLWRGA